MSDEKLSNLKELLAGFLQEKGWAIFSIKDIDHGCQVVVTDGVIRLPVNIYKTGKIVIQGKASALKDALSEWANLVQSGFQQNVQLSTAPVRQNRIAKFLVIPDKSKKIEAVVRNIPADVTQKEVGGPAEHYRFEIRQSDQKITVTQYSSGTLMLQGGSGTLFDSVCEILDDHLTQSFADRASRYLAGDTERDVAISYLEKPDSENEAVRWLIENVGQPVMDFLYDNDKRTLLAAAGVRNAFQSSKSLPDYSVVVMPFAKSFEGFVIRLAVYVGLTTEDALKRKANDIEIGNWIELIKSRLPDAKRFREIHAALEAAWQCRHKALHSDFAHPLSTLKSFTEAEHEVGTILRAMARSHKVFVEENIQLIAPEDDENTETKPERKTKPVLESDKELRFENVNRESLRLQMEKAGYKVVVQSEGRNNLWEFMDKPRLTVVAPRKSEELIIVKGSDADDFCAKLGPFLKIVDSVVNQSRIGVDESGKGDLFGPLVVAAVWINEEIELTLAKRGVRDSKTIADSQILELARFIQKTCPSEILVLLPPDYNIAYEQHGRNLNRLLAWGHAQVIVNLNKQKPASKAISDQFGDEQLLIQALQNENCSIFLEQRPKAESDIAVAAASILARAEFVQAMEEYTIKSSLQIPLGASASQVKEIGKQIYRRWGKAGLERIAKMHFKTIQEIIFEVDR